MEDLVELMKCRNCISCKEKEGKLWCEENCRETSYEETCSYWAENIGVKDNLTDLFRNIVDILKYYIDTEEDNYKIIAIWIMGTWMHSYFPTYPYLYFQAMKGSGKTRIEKLIKELSHNGEMLASLSEAVLFRTTGTLCIDEFENINSKEKNALRELLNTAYKKGGKVKRMKKKKMLDEDGRMCEQHVVEEFDTFRPIVLCNISGMEEVLGDRCINIILEKSDNKAITRKVEAFETDPLIAKTKEMLSKTAFWCSLCSVVTARNIYMDWNAYVNTTTLNYTLPLTTPNCNTTSKELLFNKIYETGIDGRNLELIMPLLLIAEEIGLTEEIIQILNRKVNEKKAEDVIESRDVALYTLVSKQTTSDWYKIKEIVAIFRQQIDFDETEEHWLNAKWVGRALKRLNLIKEKRRIAEGVEVILNITKAQEKLKIFK